MAFSSVKDVFTDCVENIPPSAKGDFYLAILQNRSHEDFFSIAKFGADCFYYAVFDGHGGGNKNNELLDSKHCVLYLKDYLHHHLCKKLKGLAYDDEKSIREAVIDTFREVDKHLHEKGGTNGSTCNVVLVTPVNTIFINLGDSRAVKIEDEDASSMATKGRFLQNKERFSRPLLNKPKIVFSTSVHTASEEGPRIRKAGGYVLEKRVNGIYLPSRAFGDYDCKLIRGKYAFEGPMSASPDVFFRPRQAGIVILGTDGLFDAFNNTTTKKVELEKMLDFVNKHSLVELPGKLVEYAKTRNANDDTTCIVVKI